MLATRTLIVGTLTLVLICAFMFARVFPAPTACMFVGVAGFHVLPDGSLTDSISPDEQQRYLRLTVESRKRIANTFGEPEAKPIIVYLSRTNEFGLFKLNAFGSTQLLGSRACVMIGPKGQSVDVVAHELMHAEIHQRVGFWHRFMNIPTWFDEGLAMQVDNRPQYALTGDDEYAKNAVRQLTTSSAFFSSSEKVVVSNYAKARALVADWVAKVGNASVYQRLDQLRDGKSFENVISMDQTRRVSTTHH